MFDHANNNLPAPRGENNLAGAQPIVVMLQRAGIVSKIVGQDGTANVILHALDAFLTNSSITSRQDYANPMTPQLFSLLPTNFVSIYEKVAGWTEVALSAGIVTEDELESYLSEPDKLLAIAARFRAE